MMSYPTMTKIYTFLWNKYRPAILNLMVASAQGPQQYKFSPHEFKSINPKEKGGYSFSMKVFQGKSLNSIKTSAVAQDLLAILQQSKKASELSEESTFEFTMDKHFVLTISKLAKAPDLTSDLPSN